MVNKWSGENYSERVWNNQEKVAEKIQEIVFQHITTGTPSSKLRYQLKDLSDLGAHASDRLIKTETSYIVNMADLETSKRLGIKYRKFVATLDKRTSIICHKNHNHIVKIEDCKVGENVPPLHPYCRSIMVDYIPGLSDEVDWSEELNKEIEKAEEVKTTHIIENEKNIQDKIVNIDLSKASVEDIIELGKEVNETYNIKEHIGDKEKLKEIFGKFRKIGGTIAEDKWELGSSRVYKKNIIVKNQLLNAFQYLPEDWANIPQNSNVQIFAKIEKERGYFNNGIDLIKGKITPYIIIATDGKREATPFHEIGHMVEWFNKDVLRIEKEWIAKRTEGEKPIQLKKLFPFTKYSRDEVVLRDNFISSYIGKIYKDGTEVLSMGIQGIFTPSELYVKAFDMRTYKKIYKKITDDEEFMNLIIGLILKG